MYCGMKWEVCACVCVREREAAAGRGDGDGWTELTVRYSSCTLERTSC